MNNLNSNLNSKINQDYNSTEHRQWIIIIQHEIIQLKNKYNEIN